MKQIVCASLTRFVRRYEMKGKEDDEKRVFKFQTHALICITAQTTISVSNHEEFLQFSCQTKLNNKNRISQFPSHFYGLRR